MGVINPILLSGKINLSRKNRSIITYGILNCAAFRGSFVLDINRIELFLFHFTVLKQGSKV